VRDTYIPRGRVTGRARLTDHRVAIAALLLAGVIQACSPPAPEREAVTDSTATARSEQDDPAAYRGAAIAGQVCAQCHSVSGIDVKSPVSGAPSFTSVANRPETTVDSLSRWLTSSHPSMPNYMFDQQSVGDLAAYIMTLPGQTPGSENDR
jgi:mono/diheme cytochrome c family protein